VTRAKKVTCPACGHGISKVIDSRGELRLRSCVQCEAHFMTTESVTKLMPRGSRRLPSPKQAAANI